MLIKKPELKIKRIRELKNLTQEYIACQLDISLRTYSKIESGETQLTIKRINQISKVLEMNPIDLLTFDENAIFVNKNKNIDSFTAKKISNEIEQLQQTVSYLMEQNMSLLNILEKK